MNQRILDLLRIGKIISGNKQKLYISTKMNNDYKMNHDKKAREGKSILKRLINKNKNNS